MISDNIKITVHIANHACHLLLKLKLGRGGLVCVCVAASEEIDTDIFTTHLLTPYKFVMTGSDLYSEQMPEERITG